MSSSRKAVYTPRGLVPHAALLGQACAHCRKSLAAATRRCGGRVSVPLWRAVLSDPRPIVALVRRHRTNQLIGRNPLPRHHPERWFSSTTPPAAECTRSCRRFPAGIPRRGAGRSRAPHPSATTRTRKREPSDLHALGPRPALILSQDQTLHQIYTMPRGAPPGRLPPLGGGHRRTHGWHVANFAKLARGRALPRARPTPHLLKEPTAPYPTRDPSRTREPDHFSRL